MNNNEVRQIVQERLLAVEARLTAACQRAGRTRQDVTLVAVTKTVSAELAKLLPELGLVDLGENRPHELWHKAEGEKGRRGEGEKGRKGEKDNSEGGAEKGVFSPSSPLPFSPSPLLPLAPRWHLIGHLQRNKIERTLPLVHLIHAVDSVRLLQALDETCAHQGRTVPVLLEVNTSGEASKQGFTPDEVGKLIPAMEALRHVHVRGLMTMAALQDPEACRPGFILLRNLRDELRAQLAEPHLLEHLSMGMTNDFEIAVEEGATLVRLGTVLFGGLENEPT